MTDDRMALKALIEQASDRELLAGMLGLVHHANQCRLPHVARDLAHQVEGQDDAQQYSRPGEYVAPDVHVQHLGEEPVQFPVGRVDLPAGRFELCLHRPLERFGERLAGHPGDRGASVLPALPPAVVTIVQGGRRPGGGGERQDDAKDPQRPVMPDRMPGLLQDFRGVSYLVYSFLRWFI